MRDFYMAAALILGNRSFSDAKKIALLKEELQSATDRNQSPEEIGGILDGLEITAAELADLGFDKLRPLNEF